MRVRIIQGTYGYPNGKYPVAKTPNDPPFELDDAMAARLLRLGVAVAVPDEAPPAAPASPTQAQAAPEPTRADLAAQAAALGLKVGKSATKAQIQAMINEHTPPEDEEEGEAPPQFDAAPPVL